MDAALSRLDGGEFVGLIVSLMGIVCASIVVITAFVAPKWQQVRRVEAEMKLKRDLIASGYSADDIERILRASSGAPTRRAPEIAYAYRR